MKPTLTCLVPAWNEATRLPGVLAALVGHPLIDRLLVIDDGSTDGTAEVARGLGAEVLALTPNRGKTGALAEGIARLDGDFVMLIDADLEGLTPNDITRLARPVLSGAAEVSLSLRGNAPAIWHWLGVDYISGERVLPVDLLKDCLETLPSLPRFGFEVFLNQQIRERGLRPAIVELPDVISPTKAAKQGLMQGIKGDAGMLRDILRCQPVDELVAQIAYLRRGAPHGLQRNPFQNRTWSASAAAVNPTTNPNQTPTPPSPTMNPRP